MRWTVPPAGDLRLDRRVPVAVGLGGGAAEEARRRWRWSSGCPCAEVRSARISTHRAGDRGVRPHDGLGGPAEVGVGVRIGARDQAAAIRVGRDVRVGQRRVRRHPEAAAGDMTFTPLPLKFEPLGTPTDAELLSWKLVLALTLLPATRPPPAVSPAMRCWPSSRW